MQEVKHTPLYLMGLQAGKALGLSDQGLTPSQVKDAGTLLAHKWGCTTGEALHEVRQGVWDGYQQSTQPLADE